MHEKTWSCHCFNGAEKTAEKNVNKQSLLVSVAAGNMDLGCLVFLSSHIMHHLFIQLNTNTGCGEQLRERPGTAPSGENKQEVTEGRQGWFQTKHQHHNVCVRHTVHFKDGPFGRPSRCICQFVSCHNPPFCVCVQGSVSLLFCFWLSDTSRLPCTSSKWWLMTFAELWQGADVSRGRAFSPNVQLNPTCPCPGCLGYMQVVKCYSLRECEKLCLIPSPGSHLRFHTLLSGHSAELCWGSRVPLTSWHNGCFGLISIRCSYD